MNKPFSQACENNKQPILDVLNEVLKQQKHVLEIGSGTGQHAVYFARKMPHITWQTSDLLINHEGINQWIDAYPLQNIKRPFTLNLEDNYRQQKLKFNSVDALYTANTLHIISWTLVLNFFKLVEKNLIEGGKLCIYGPFNYKGSFTSESNANFDMWLKERDKHSGIRNIEDVHLLATQSGLILRNDLSMPANNRFLIFEKKS